MNLSYKYRIYPTKEQTKDIDWFVFCYNQAYNSALNLIQTKGYDMYLDGENGNFIFKHIYDSTRSILGNRQIKDKSALTQDAVRNAYNSLFTNIKQKKKFQLHFRDSRSLEGSFPVRNTNGTLTTNIDTNTAEFKFFQLTVKVKLHRDLLKGYRTLGYRIKRENERYFVVVNLTNDKKEPKLPKLPKLQEQTFNENDFLGIDSNQGNYTCSNGFSYDFVKSIYPKLEQKRKTHQRNLSKKQKGSKQRTKNKKLLFNTSRKIKNRRKHEIHQRANLILNEGYKVQVVEKLDIKKMTQKNQKGQKNLNRQQTKNMLHIAHSEFFSVLDYKSRLMNRYLIRVNPAYTSMTCSGCGLIKKMELSQRVYQCESCGLQLDRDLNASINIKRLGISLCSLKQEATDLNP